MSRRLRPIIETWGDPLEMGLPMDDVVSILRALGNLAGVTVDDQTNFEFGDEQSPFMHFDPAEPFLDYLENVLDPLTASTITLR